MYIGTLDKHSTSGKQPCLLLFDMFWRILTRIMLVLVFSFPVYLGSQLHVLSFPFPFSVFLLICSIAELIETIQ